MLPLFSPAISVVVYIFGNTPWAAKASDSNSPPLTRSRTFSRICFSCVSLCRLISRSSEFRIGNPARIRVRNCWLKDQECALLQLSAPPERNPAGEQSLRLDPVDEISLLREAVVDFGFGVAVLDLLRASGRARPRFLPGIPPFARVSTVFPRDTSYRLSLTLLLNILSRRSSPNPPKSVRK